jgi:L-threonylcarbamoyladenylate synthase
MIGSVDPACYTARVMVSATTISEAARTLREGGLVAFPTETVYGLGADATNDQAVARIFAAKSRPEINPLISHLATADEAESYGRFSESARKLARAFWPGPLTLVVERSAGCKISQLCSAGLDSVALRVPNHPVALALLKEVRRPVAAPSANRSGRISPTTAEHVRRSLGGAVDMIVDGGRCRVGLESTVVQFDGKAVRLLRPGGLPRQEIERVLGQRLDTPKPGTTLHSPGLLDSHYAPHAGLRLNAIEPIVGESYIGFGKHAFGPHSLSKTGDLIEAAANLFKVLHEVDALNPGRIAVAPIPVHGLGEAINDRLRRAAAPRTA